MFLKLIFLELNEDDDDKHDVICNQFIKELCGKSGSGFCESQQNNLQFLI